MPKLEPELEALNQLLEQKKREISPFDYWIMIEDFIQKYRLEKKWHALRIVLMEWIKIEEAKTNPDISRQQQSRKAQEMLEAIIENEKSKNKRTSSPDSQQRYSSNIAPIGVNVTPVSEEVITAYRMRLNNGKVHREQISEMIHILRKIGGEDAIILIAELYDRVLNQHEKGIRILQSEKHSNKRALIELEYGSYLRCCWIRKRYFRQEKNY